MKLDLSNCWQVLQDVHDTCEKLGIFMDDYNFTAVGPQISEWEPIEELKHLQLLFAQRPYYGRELRYFNQAPWWYKKDFFVPEDAGAFCRLNFAHADYFCRVWLNGVYLGEHEGYSSPFSFDAGEIIKRGEENHLVVKVWSPWDEKIDQDKADGRTFTVIRDLTKGTYEHSDTFVQRDVNPVGLYGSVSAEFHDGAYFEQAPQIRYTLDISDKRAALEIKTLICAGEADGLRLAVRCYDCLTGACVFQTEKPAGTGENHISGTTEEIRLWNTWDRGGAFLYKFTITLLDNGGVLDSMEETTGFRNIVLRRDEKTTVFILNGKQLFVRGTSYFPDIYMSAMYPERYKRDMHGVKAAGFNAVRVHVHVENPEFYKLCDELGIAVIQDSEFNWTHPVDEEWTSRFISIFKETVSMLNPHPCIICWICMNEPAGRTTGRAMQVSPGPELYKQIIGADPSRPAIKGSFCSDDPTSGDSHNYTGSLDGDCVHYSKIFGSTEKFNTEFGFDAPGCAENLKKEPRIIGRLKKLAGSIDEIQHYQYRLIKYYMEHYRMQKYVPCSGYVHFLYSDLCPQSFYGIYDWWGIPKAGLDAALESNMPIGIFARYNEERIEEIVAVNDTTEDFEPCVAEWMLTDGEHNILMSEKKAVSIPKDGIISVRTLHYDLKSKEVLNLSLVLMDKEERVIAKNRYSDIAHMPEHVKGHPSRMSHESGVRLYWA